MTPETLSSREIAEQLHQKYYAMIESIGVDETITQMHRDIGRLEPRVFDGGFEKDRFEKIQIMRNLARDLYNYKLEQASKEYRK